MDRGSSPDPTPEVARSQSQDPRPSSSSQVIRVPSPSQLDTMARIFSLNVHGLNSNKKRHLALREFKQSGADIIFVQETHFDRGGTFAFASRHFPQSYLSSGPHKRAGVAILIKQGSPFVCESHYSDLHGHYVIVRGRWQSREITLCALYIPNVKQHRFLSKMFTRLFRSDHGILVVGGDFNLTHSVTADRHVVDPRNHQLEPLETRSYFANSLENMLSLMPGGLSTQGIGSTPSTQLPIKPTPGSTTFLLIILLSE